MACGDPSTRFLKNLGYNVVKHPRMGIRPLELIGRQNDSVSRLGVIEQLITQSDSARPTVLENENAANVNGQTSASMTLGIGLNILGTILSAMGGNLGVNASYTNARKITFVYTDVVSDRVQPLDVGNFLRDGDVDAGNLILKEYVLGNGELYLITETVKSKKFSVQHEARDGVELKVDVPVLKQLVGGNVTVTTANETSRVVSFEGKDALTFGFKCLRVGVEDGLLRLLSSPPGDTALEAAVPAEAVPVILSRDGLLEVGF